ncbi:IS66 family insertion sequence element accessory protein TnpB [uncultured Jannaschia sp.]|uniref:IS66 family insertion sequence element accessory protein TnpB n=1 Tax=uncultured Jannaschia sp. TaxID=293347 RepID=UPI00262C4832|nr:IS66 family insertion sequence element accessory protein TnpB [uncultured Jannaschia sp.]
MSLYTKRLEAGKFIWPAGGSGEAVQISAAQIGYLLDGIDWRNPRWTRAACEGGISSPDRPIPLGLSSVLS